MGLRFIVSSLSACLMIFSMFGSCSERTRNPLGMFVRLVTWISSLLARVRRTVFLFGMSVFDVKFRAILYVVGCVCLARLSMFAMLVCFFFFLRENLY